MPIRADRLKEQRKKHGFSAEELANRIGIHARQINRYEANESDATGNVLVNLSKELNVTTDYLLGLTDDPLGEISEGDLSPMERLLIDAYRRDDLRELLKIINDDPNTRRRTDTQGDQAHIR